MAFLSALSSAGYQAAAQHSTLLGLAVLVTAVGVLALEFRQRARTIAPEVSGGLLGANIGAISSPQRGLRMLGRLMPECCGLVFCFAITGLLRIYRPNGQAIAPEDARLWQEIQAEWPVLATADTLVGMQALLRVLLLSSAALRTKQALASPLAGLPTVFLLLAACAQVALLALSPPDVYHLDGPLGGFIDIFMEVVALALLAYLAVVQACQSRRSLSWKSAQAVALSLAALGWAAWMNRLALADQGDAHLDALFSLQNLLQLAAALAFLVRGVHLAADGIAPGPFTALACVLLPLQQLLAAYFLLTAWGGAPLEELRGLVGAGQPFKMLQLGAVAQVGAYAAAGVTQLVLGSEAEKQEQCGPYIDV